MRIVVVGDALLDRDIDGHVERVCPDAPVPVVDSGAEVARPGGAALAAALLARHRDDDIVLLTALGPDRAAVELRALLDDTGVEVVDLGLSGATPEKVRLRAAGQSLLRLDRGGSPAPIGPLSSHGRHAFDAADAVLVADYGRGIVAQDDVRAAIGARCARPVVWDPHRRGPDPVAGVRLATPNAVEAAAACPPTADGLAGITSSAEALAARWRAGAVAVTLGSRGALVAGHGGAPLVVPAPVAVGGDPCGAGDCFAGAAVRALARGAVVSEAVEAAVAVATAFVAAGGVNAIRFADGHDVVTGATSPPTRGSSAGTAREVATRVRARGGTVVATGGCFDLLHAGHVATLRAARRLGDCLIVCLNGDDSVRRLKGPDRPLQPEADRAEVLGALDCVDAVEIFHDDTPLAVLDELRPDIFVKGGDYTAAELPEAATLARWGGQAVVVPYLAGRSSSRLIQEARRVPT